jgi:hypothetical protein
VSHISLILSFLEKQTYIEIKKGERIILVEQLQERNDRIHIWPVKSYPIYYIIQCPGLKVLKRCYLFKQNIPSDLFIDDPRSPRISNPVA